MKKWIQVTVVIAVAGILAGTAWSYSRKQEKEEEAEKLEHTELTLCLIGAEPNDMDMVLEKFNTLTERDLNCLLYTSDAADE